MNVIALIGNLTQDPALRTAGDTVVCDLRIAVDRGPGRDGTSRGTDYFDVTAFGNTAEACAQYLTRGRQIAVHGRLHHDTWRTDDDQPRQRVQVIAQQVQFLARPAGNGDQQAADAAHADAELATAAATAEEEDPIPF